MLKYTALALLLALIVVNLFSFISIVSAYGETRPGPIKLCQVSVSNYDDLNVRATPGGIITSRLLNNERVAIVDTRNVRGPWVFISLPQERGEGEPLADGLVTYTYVPLGWVHMAYLKNCTNEYAE